MSSRVTPNIYDHVYDTLLNLTPHLLLARAEYGVDFVRQAKPNGTWDYVNAGTDLTYETILVGEIRPMLCGTRFSTKGTHYVGSPLNPTLIDDKMRVKSFFVLGKPTDCTEELGALFDNQLLTLRSVIERDAAELKAAKKSITFKEWTSRADSASSGDPDYINIVTDPMYVIPKPGSRAVVHSRKKHALMRCADRGKPDSSLSPATFAGSESPKKADQHKGKHAKNPKTTNPIMNANNTMDIDPEEPVSSSKGTNSELEAAILGPDAASSAETSVRGRLPLSVAWIDLLLMAITADISTNDVYHPNDLYDHSGDLFKQESAMLRQLDFRDVDDALIPPDSWYSVLNQGSLVMVRTSLHAFHYETRRVYQLNAHTIKVLDGSTLDVEIRFPTSLSSAPTTSSPSEAAKAMATVQLGKQVHDDSA